MKIHEGHGPVSLQIDKQNSRKKSSAGDFQRIIKQLNTSVEIPDKVKVNEKVGPILNSVQILHGVENKKPSMGLVQRDRLLESLYETLDMVDFYAARLAGSSISADDLHPLINHLEVRLNSLREMESVPGIPEPLKSVITDMSITVGMEIMRFKRGDYS